MKKQLLIAAFACSSILAMAQEHVRRFEIAYKAESFCGDKLSFYCQSDDEKVYDVEVRKNEGEVVCQARVFFEAKNVAR